MASNSTDRSSTTYAAGAPYAPTSEEQEWVNSASWAEVIDMLGKSAAYLHHMAGKQTDNRTRMFLRGAAGIVRQVQNRASITAESTRTG